MFYSLLSYLLSFELWSGESRRPIVSIGDLPYGNRSETPHSDINPDDDEPSSTLQTARAASEKRERVYNLLDIVERASVI